MKLIQRRLLIAATATCFALTVGAQACFAGQWWDSVFGRRQPVYPVGSPVPVNGPISAYSPSGYPSAGYVPPSYANLNNTQVLGYGNYASPPNYNAPLFAPGFPQTIAGQLPTAAYDSQWARTPVTYYRPVTAYDPRYGTTVTSLQPCTSYQYQAQRQPVIAPPAILGSYGFQSNPWPSITGPGYNPTGLSTTAMYAPVAQPIRSIPSTGMAPMVQPNSFALMGGSGVSSGMPSSSLPINTMSYSPPNPMPGVGQQQAFYNGQNYNGQVVVNPAYTNTYSSTPTVGWPSQTIGSGVMPTAAYMPATAACPNGICPQPNSQVNILNIPGATVTPMGPPTYSSTPNPNIGSGGQMQPVSGAFGSSPSSTMGPAYAPPNTGATSDGQQSFGQPPSYPPVMPNGQVLPNGQALPNGQMVNPNSNLVDPDSMRRPTLGGSNASTTPAPNLKASSPNVQSLPMVAVDGDATRSSNTVNPFMLSKPSFSGPATLLNPEGLAMGTPGNDSRSSSPGALEIPQTLTPRENYDMQPLNAPDGFDGKPQWNPTLLNPEDRTVLNGSNQLREARKIRLREDSDFARSTVAIKTTNPNPNRNAIQLVSGVESVKSATEDSSPIRFRPVTALQ